MFHAVVAHSTDPALSLLGSRHAAATAATRVAIASLLSLPLSSADVFPRSSLSSKNLVKSRL
jgi:hypothetical protein